MPAHAQAVLPARSPVPRLGSLSAFFPVCDERTNVLPMAEAMLAVLPRVAARWELIIVDDGSRDGTSQLADDFAARHVGVRVIHHHANRGYGAAIRSGLAAAQHEHVFFTDGDRQFDPAEIALLIPALGWAEVVVGYRRTRADSAFRRWNTSAWNRLTRLLLGIPIRDVNCAFKLLRRDALDGIVLESEGAVLSAELIARLYRRGRRIVEVAVDHYPRRSGTPTGARPRVIARALLELASLYRRIDRAS